MAPPPRSAHVGGGPLPSPAVGRAERGSRDRPAPCLLRHVVSPFPQRPAAAQLGLGAGGSSYTRAGSGCLAGAEGFRVAVWGTRDGADVRVWRLAVRRDLRPYPGSLGVQGVSPFPFHPFGYGRALVSPGRKAAGCARLRWVRARLGAGRVA